MNRVDPAKTNSSPACTSTGSAHAEAPPRAGSTTVSEPSSPLINTVPLELPKPCTHHRPASLHQMRR